MGKRDELIERMNRAQHGMQAGVGLEIEKVGEKEAAANPKYLRVGVNTALVEMGSLGGLLIKKGLITEEEYLEAMAEGYEKEHRRYEEHISRLYGRPIKLG